MAGRPRKPDHLKIVAGTAQPCRMNPAAPKPERKRIIPPDHLTRYGKEGWEAAVSIAHSMGVLTVADTLAMESLAEAIADIRAARASLAAPLIQTTEDGRTVQVAAGGERYYWTGGLRRQRPELADISDADRRINSWVSKFGMTPADRSKVSASPEEKRNPFAELA